MKQLQHVEAGDKIYALLNDEVIEVTLTEDHINDRSSINPAFLVGSLRLKSTAVENGQIELEQGHFYDNSVGMSVDYGYRFDETEAKAFSSREALNQYLSKSRQKIELLQTSLEQLNEKINLHTEVIMKDVEEHVSYLKSIDVTDNDLFKIKDYEWIDRLHKLLGGKSIFYRDRVFK